MVSTHLKNNIYSVEETAEKVAKIETIKELNSFFDSNKIWQDDENIISIFEERKNAINEGL